jgi:hypothetical protein
LGGREVNKKLLTIITAIGAALSLGLGACTGGGSSGTTVTPVPPSGSTIRITINAGSSNVCSYYNAACATVTICQPGTSNCDTVDNILVDTGSFGLRVFGSLLTNTNNSLTTMQANGQPVSECVTYADTTANWGPVKYASVTLNSTTTATQIPIQVIDASSPGVSNCSGASSTPTAFGVNGILGVGPLRTDQGYSSYYTCNGSTCSQATPPSYVPNPITQFATDNNGLTLTFASVPSSGSVSADGYGIFGVGTNNTNTPASGTHIFQISQIGGINVTVSSNFNGTNYPSYLDTGSQAYFFTSQFWPNCSGSLSGLYCPSSEVSNTATMTGFDGLGNSTTATINFNIGNASDLLNNSTNNAFSNIGARVVSGTPLIDWGLPFYLGKTVYMVFAGSTATINGVTLPASTSGYWIY